MDETEWSEDTNEKTEWDNVTRVLVESAAEVCGVASRSSQHPWILGHEKELEEMWREIQRRVERRNEAARRRLRAGVLNRRLERLEAEVKEERREVKETRRRLKGRSRNLEREWWEERITEECELAGNMGRMGVMYGLLRKMCARGQKAGASVRITVNEYKGYFERVSAVRYEVDMHVLNEVIEGVEDLRKGKKRMR